MTLGSPYVHIVPFRFRVPVETQGAFALKSALLNGHFGLGRSVVPRALHHPEPDCLALAL